MNVTRDEPNPGRSASIRKVDSRTLLAGEKELIIVHRSETYRLRLTANDKLILTK